MIGSSPRSARPAPWAAVGIAVLATLALLGGMADLHLHGGGSTGEGVGHLERLAAEGETVFAGASHPAAAPHAESAGEEIHVRCPVCALHLQAADEGPGDALAGRVSTSSALGGRPTAVLASAALFRPGGPRAPPSR